MLLRCSGATENKPLKRVRAPAGLDDAKRGQSTASGCKTLAHEAILHELRRRTPADLEAGVITHSQIHHNELR